jgi:hypothetical protein
LQRLHIEILRPQLHRKCIVQCKIGCCHGNVPRNRMPMPRVQAA